MSEWASIVYGRSLFVDFRLLVKPKDDSLDIPWLEKHIQSTTCNPQDLSIQLQRWSLFKNKSHSILGVTCRASVLSDKYIRDSSDRSLYVFVGYVSRSQCPQIPDLKLDEFKLSYEKIASERWEEQNFQVQKNNLKYQSEYRPLFRVSSKEEDFSNIEVSSKLEDMNQDERQLFIFPGSNNLREIKSYFVAASEAKSPISVCSGLPNSKDILSSPFLNLICNDVVQKEIKKKVVSNLSKKENQKDEQLTKEKTLSEPRYQESPKSQDKNRLLLPKNSVNQDSRLEDDNPLVGLLSFLGVKNLYDSFVGGAQEDVKKTEAKKRKSKGLSIKSEQLSRDRQSDSLKDIGSFRKKTSTDVVTDKIELDDNLQGVKHPEEDMKNHEDSSDLIQKEED